MTQIATQSIPPAVTPHRHGMMTQTHCGCCCCCLPDKLTQLCPSVLSRTSLRCPRETHTEASKTGACTPNEKHHGKSMGHATANPCPCHLQHKHLAGKQPSAHCCPKEATGLTRRPSSITQRRHAGDWKLARLANVERSRSYFSPLNPQPNECSKINWRYFDELHFFERGVRRTQLWVDFKQQPLGLKNEAKL